MLDDKYKWPLRFLAEAALVAQRSKDPSTKVGAVIVDAKKRTVGSGYNGFPRGVKDLAVRYENREIKYPMVIHAEVNAILNAAYTEGCTLYCTHFPCPRCAGIIIQAGIVRIVAWTNPEYDVRCRDEQGMSVTMFDEAGIAHQRLINDQKII